MSANQEEAAAKRDRHKVHPGEPGCNVVTDFKDGGPILKNPPVTLALLPIESKEA